jgi:lambda family phage holin
MINWLKEADSSLWGVFMSIIMAVLRIVRDNEEDKFFRIAVEALLCGAITFTIGSGVKALGYEGWDQVYSSRCRTDVSRVWSGGHS